jgi:hypothetical protein
MYKYAFFDKTSVHAHQFMRRVHETVCHFTFQNVRESAVTRRAFQIKLQLRRVRFDRGTMSNAIHFTRRWYDLPIYSY